MKRILLKAKRKNNKEKIINKTKQMGVCDSKKERTRKLMGRAKSCTKYNIRCVNVMNSG